MSRMMKWGIGLAVVLVLAVIAASQAGLIKKPAVNYREVEVTRGRIAAVVNSTGTVKPVRTVTVGSFVSGPIAAIYADHNAEVKKDDLLAKIDPRIYKAAVDRDQAILATQKANVEQTKAKLQQARNDEARSKALRAQNKGFISDAEMDQFRFGRMALEAQLALMEAGVAQAEATLNTSLLNLGYCEIRSPVDGTVIERKVDGGQTVAAAFQTPDLFVVAPDLRKEMHVYANVDETDIGLVDAAQKSEQPVRFTVSSEPDILFIGKIHQVRQKGTTTQNVVTYPVIVSVSNPDLKLKSEMTAHLSFQTGERKDVLRVPNAALRYFPPRDQVRKEDHKILDGNVRDEKDEEAVTVTRSADEIAEGRQKRHHRHVWVVGEGGLLRAIPVVTGLSDSKLSEIVSGDVAEGQKVVTGVRPRGVE